MHLGHVLGLEMIEVPIFSHEVILDMLVKTKANCIFSEPSLWIRLCEDEKYKNVDLSFLYEAVYGGGKLTVYQIARINQFLVEHNAKCLLRVGYGLSEFNGTCILENPFMSSVGSCGKDLIGGEGIILDEDTKKEVPNGQKGMLYYTKASMPVCEFDGKILHKPIEINGKNYIDTGDIMSKNDAGEYFFSTRASGMICRYDGYKVYPNVIEETLTATPYVEDCMVSEYYDEEKYGMMPIVYIIPSKQFNIDDSDKIIYEIIEQYILNNPNMTYRDIPKKWKIVSTLPVTSSLKKNYKKIKEIGIDGSEINVICAETNMGLDQIEISLPEKDKKLIRKLKK